MLSMRDCLDYCDLSDEAVALFAEYEHLPCEVAATIACGLVQSHDGIREMEHCFARLIDQAVACGQFARAEHVLQVFAEFKAAHPVLH